MLKTLDRSYLAYNYYKNLDGPKLFSYNFGTTLTTQKRKGWSEMSQSTIHTAVIVVGYLLLLLGFAYALDYPTRKWQRELRKKEAQKRALLSGYTFFVNLPVITKNRKGTTNLLPEVQARLTAYDAVGDSNQQLLHSFSITGDVTWRDTTGEDDEWYVVAGVFDIADRQLFLVNQGFSAREDFASYLIDRLVEHLSATQATA